jgi:hypothetical protein
MSKSTRHRSGKSRVIAASILERLGETRPRAQHSRGRKRSGRYPRGCPCVSWPVQPGRLTRPAMRLLFSWSKPDRSAAFITVSKRPSPALSCRLRRSRSNVSFAATQRATPLNTLTSRLGSNPRHQRKLALNILPFCTTEHPRQFSKARRYRPEMVEV